MPDQLPRWRIHKCRRGRNVWHVDEIADGDFSLEYEFRTGAEAIARFAKGWVDA